MSATRRKRKRKRRLKKRKKKKYERLPSPAASSKRPQFSNGHQGGKGLPNNNKGKDGDPRTKFPAGVSFPYQYKRPDKEEMELYTYWSDHLKNLDSSKNKRNKHKHKTKGDSKKSGQRVKIDDDKTIVIKASILAQYILVKPLNCAIPL